jgi:pimeloyl-ACP methyl ester carboxylesterase
MGGIPDVQYAEGLDGLIAYETVGDYPVDLVHIGMWNQTVEGIWELPSAERFYRRLASFARLVLVDRRGTGLSDPLRSRYGGGDFGPWIEEAVNDFVTVFDALDAQRVAVVSSQYGAAVAISLAAGHPDRVEALVLVDPMARLLEAEDYPWGMSLEMRETVAGWCRVGWGDGMLSGLTPAHRGPGVVPSFRHDAEAHRWLARYERAGIPRGHMAAWWSEWEFDVRPLLPLIQAPTMVMHTKPMSCLLPARPSTSPRPSQAPLARCRFPRRTSSSGQRSHRCSPTGSSASSPAQPVQSPSLPTARLPWSSSPISSTRRATPPRWAIAAGESSSRCTTPLLLARSNVTEAGW